MAESIAIGRRKAGTGYPAYIVAEMSANHNQDYGRAVEIVHAAAEAGADAIKLQTYTPDTITIDSDKPYFRISGGTLWDGETLYSLYERAYTPWDWQPRLMEEAAKLPPEYKINGINTKYIFRKAANRSLPNEWADRTKKGFPVPIRKWLREDKYYGDVKSYFTSDTAAEYFDQSALIRLLDDHREERANNGRKIWTAYTFLVWHKQFFGE